MDRDAENTILFCSIRNVLIERMHIDYIGGLYIDVFPIDEWNDSENASRLYDDYHVAMWNYRKALSYQTWKEIIIMIVNFW